MIAPGASCNAKSPLFERIGQEGALAGFTVVRFEWAYCAKPAAERNPSPKLELEIEDYVTVLNYAKTLPGIDASRLLLAGKSQGSLVAYAVFRQTPEAKALALLTPVCSYTTDDDGKLLAAPLRVGEENYPSLKMDPRPVLMTMGDQDDLCRLAILFDYLKDSRGNIEVSVAGGDHGFNIKKNGTVDNLRTARNILNVVNHLLNWADLKL